MSRFPTSLTPRGAITQKSMQILAVAALDEMVTSLVKASRLKLSPRFLDWIADEATPLVEQSVEHFFRNDRFVASLHAGDPKIAISLWVRHWVCPRITAGFEQLAPHVAEFSESIPAALTTEPPRPAPAATPRYRFPRQLQSIVPAPAACH
ncbi:hypothetical protein [Polaromonas sp. YR568]|uniref:hypothetical protein n=1 Tax=Polaromonas sp. YR568 TaxID=1855301 RepID=UPI00398BBF89